MVADASSCNAPVRFYRGNQKHFFHAGAIPEQLITGCVRIRGYLWGAFSKNAEYIIWNKHAFSRKSYTEGRKGYTVQYVEKLMRTFRKMTTEFKIEVIHYKGHPRLKVTPIDGTPADAMQDIRRRLTAYVRNSARGGRPAKVGAEFLNRFIKTTGQPAELVVAVWLRLKFVPGCHVRWRGVGANLRFEVSLQQSSPPHSSPTGRRFIQTGPTAHRLLTGASPPHVGRLQTESSPPTGTAGPQSTAESECRSQRWRASDTSKTAEALEGWTAAAIVHRIAAMNVAEAAGISAGDTADPGAAGSAAVRSGPHAPFEIGGRWISGRKLQRYASWLALNPLRGEHAWQPHVEFIFGYAQNFAERAMRAGHHRDAILAAYAYGVQHANKDALDAHVKAPPRRDDNGEWRPPEKRVPSSAIAYAWRELRRDSRSREQRWAAMMAGPRPARLGTLAGAEKSAATPKAARIDRQPARADLERDTARRGKFKTLQEIFSPQEKRAIDLEPGDLPTISDIKARLDACGMTWANWAALNYRQKMQFVQSARGQLKKKAP